MSDSGKLLTPSALPRDVLTSTKKEKQLATLEDVFYAPETTTPGLSRSNLKEDSLQHFPTRSCNEPLSSISKVAVPAVEKRTTSSRSCESSLLTDNKGSPVIISAPQNSTQLESHKYDRYVNRTIGFETVPEMLGLFLELVCRKNDRRETYCNYLLKNTKPTKAFEDDFPFRHSKYLHESNAMNIPVQTLAKLIPTACRILHEERWGEVKERGLERYLKALQTKVSTLKHSSKRERVRPQDLNQHGKVEELLIKVLNSIEILCIKEESSKLEKTISEKIQEVCGSIYEVYPVMKQLQIHNIRDTSQTWNQDYLEQTSSSNNGKGQHTGPFYKIKLTKQVPGATTSPDTISCDQIIQTWQCSGNRKKCIVIEGAAGSGKSALLLKIFHDFTYHSSSSDDSFPGIGKFDQAFYIDCRNDASDNFSCFLDTHLHPSMTSKAELKTISKAFKEMKLLFLLDSFESFTENSVQLVNDVFNVFRRNKHVLYLIASRPLGWSTFLGSFRVDMPLDHDTYLINELSEKEQESFLRLYEEKSTSNLSADNVHVIDKFRDVRESCANYSPYGLPSFLCLFWHMLRFCPQKYHEWTTEYSLLSQALTLCQTGLKNRDFILRFGDLIIDRHSRASQDYSLHDKKISACDYRGITNDSILDSMCVKKNSLWNGIFEDGIPKEKRKTDIKDTQASSEFRQSFVADVSAQTQNQFLEYLVAESLVRRLQANPQTAVLELFPQHSMAEDGENGRFKPRFSLRYINILTLTILGLLKCQTRDTGKCLKNLFQILDDARMDFEFWAKIVSVSHVTLLEIKKKYSISETDYYEVGNHDHKTSKNVSKAVPQAERNVKNEFTKKVTKLGHEKVHDYVVQKAVGALAKPQSGNKAWIIRDSWQLQITAQMLGQLVREAQPSALLVDIPDHCIPSSSHLIKLLQMLKRCYYGSFWLRLNNSYKYYVPCDNEVQALQLESVEVRQKKRNKQALQLEPLEGLQKKKKKWRYKLWEFRGCIYSKRAVQALVSVEHRTAIGSPQLCISLCKPLRHELQFLQGRPHTLSVKVRYEAMSVTDELKGQEEKFSCLQRRPLPSGNRPPDLTVEDVSPDGGVAAGALIRALAPNDKRFRYLRLERCGLSDDGLKQLWLDLFDDGLRTMEGGRPPMAEQSQGGTPCIRNVTLHLREDANCQVVPKVESSRRSRSSESSSESSTSSEAEHNDDDGIS